MVARLWLIVPNFVVADWHISDMALVIDDVRSQRRSGNYLLFLSISHFDPERAPAMPAYPFSVAIT
jgi:hypothetical protein